ncbi:hypothetical protein ADK38_02590, partial [Streptomyces varsoviensis]
GRRVLIVLDNAATAAQVRPLLPGGPGCLTLVTSQDRLSGLAVRDGAIRLPLETLAEADAVALLRAVVSGARSGDDAERLAELARLCVGLPLALRLLAERAVSHPHLDLDDLIAELRDETSLWDALSTGDDEEAEAVRTVFASSYQALPEPAARLFRLIGVLPGPEFSPHAAAALAAAPLARTRRLLDTLAGAYLVRETGPDRYELHDLLFAYAAVRARAHDPADEREAALRRVLTWYLRTANAAHVQLMPNALRLPPAPADEDVVPLSFDGYHQAKDWYEREQANILAGVHAAAEAGFDDLVWQLAAVLWLNRLHAIPVSEWIEVARLGLAAARPARCRASG